MVCILLRIILLVFFFSCIAKLSESNEVIIPVFLVVLKSVCVCSAHYNSVSEFHIVMCSKISSVHLYYTK